jgi:hypothetical protein
MKNLSLRSFALILFIAAVSVVAFGQDAPATGQTAAAPGTVKIGLSNPKANFSEGVDNAQMASGLRELIGQYFQGSNVEIVRIEALLPKAAAAEAKEKGCAYLLQVAVSQKKGGGGFGMFKMIAPVIGNVVPMAGMGAGVAGQVAGSVAQTAIMSAANMSSTTKSKDQFTFDYSLISTETNAVKAGSSVKAKAKSDGEDVLTPMVEAMAEAISQAVK